jgi:Ca-activated chloride channel family protein
MHLFPIRSSVAKWLSYACRYTGIMKLASTPLLALLFAVAVAQGQTSPPSPPATATTTASTAKAAPDNKNLNIDAAAAGDSADGVVVKITFRFVLPSDVPQGTPLVIQGSVLSAGQVVKNFRYAVQNEHDTLSSILTLAPGEYDIEARLMVPLEETAPVIVGKTSKHVSFAKTGTAYVADASAGAEGIIAEGMLPEAAGSVKILPPRRDVAPNLFIVDVEVRPPVKKVEFWVEGKKILTRNAPPYRAELDLGALPKRVEVRAVGYDAAGRYLDADAWIVNERETPLEVKITRTVTPDNVSHFKLSIQNPKNTTLKTIELFAGKTKLMTWTRPPYAIDIPNARLAGVDFVRASVIDDTNYEASDLVFLNGDRYTEQIDVNLVELPVTVLDQSGAPITGLAQSNFQVLEQGKPQKISSFNFANNLPISAGVLLDHSGSMQPRMKAAKEAAVQFFRDIIHGQDRAFIGGFSFDVSKVAPFVSDVASLEAQVQAIPDAEGGTSLYDAIVTGLYRFRAVEGRKALIIVTDGEDTTSRVSYEDMLHYVRSARVPIYFIGIGLGIGDFGGESKMKAIAAETGAVAYFIRNAQGLKETYAKLQNDLRSQYLIGYYAESMRKDQAYRTVEVKVDRKDAKVRTIRGYIP